MEKETETETETEQKFSYMRDKKPMCHICKKRFKSLGNDKWQGNCIHFRGKVVEW